MFEPYLTHLYPAYAVRCLFKPEKHVRHQQTCPVCGRKLVNTYFQYGAWKCRECLEEAQDGEK